VKRSLLLALRRMVAEDPDPLPRIDLYILRHWAATRHWLNGVSSAWLMQWLHHANWATMKNYLAAAGAVCWSSRADINNKEDQWLWWPLKCRRQDSWASTVQRKRRADYISEVWPRPDLEEEEDMPKSEEDGA